MSTPSTSAPTPLPFLERLAILREHLPTLPQALASLMQTVVVALFVLTFVLQPLLIPSESMERTLLVGDFLLFNKQVYAPSGAMSRWLLPYRDVARGDIVVFHHSQPPMLIKRVVGLPGDRLRIAGGQVFVNGHALDEPYAVFEPAPPNPARDNFPGKTYTDFEVDPDWWFQMQSLTRDGELMVPADRYFVLATTAITARTRASGDLCRARPSSPGLWLSTSPWCGRRRPTCGLPRSRRDRRPRMIDSDTNGILPIT